MPEIFDAPEDIYMSPGRDFVVSTAGVERARIRRDGSTSGVFSSSGSLTPTAVKTGAYTAGAGEFVPVSTAGGAVTVTLPNAPAARTMVGVKMVIQSGTNAVTIATQGSDVFNKSGGSTTATLSLLNQGLVLVYDGAGIWYVQADDLPLSQLDTRYASVVDPLAVATGFRNWNTHPASFNTNTALTSQAIYAQAIWLPAGPVTGLALHVITAGVVGSGSAPTGFFLGLASPTTMLAQTANLATSSALTTIGFAQFPLSAVYTIPTAGLYYIFILENGAFNGTGSTTVKFLSSNAVYGGIPGSPPLGGTVGTSQTALPANGAAVTFDAGSSNGGKFVAAY